MFSELQWNRQGERAWQSKGGLCIGLQMKLRILTWNVRRVNDCDKRNVVKPMIRSRKVDLVCLHETKIQEISTSLVRSLGVGKWLDWGVVNLRGATRGVLVFWDNWVLSWLESKWVNVWYHASLKIARMVSFRFLQGCRALRWREVESF